MAAVPPDDIRALAAALDGAERDARALVEGLTDARGTWRAAVGSWSVAECLDHLATANRVYLRAMQAPAMRARSHGRWRRGPAMPGLVGGWFVRALEPPVRPRLKMKAPGTIRPRHGPSLADAASAFFVSQQDVHAFLDAYAAIDLAGIRFPNPFIPGVRFSLATGVHVIVAHERRHLWQAWNVRRAAEAAAGLATHPHEGLT